MEIYGNKTTFNMETVLRKNIVDSDYYRAIHTYETWSEVIDEIYNEVDSVEPWLTGNARGPSTAFCCLHKLCTLQLSQRDISQTLSHPDSPYIRAVGFLYLRYVCDPKQMWGWVEQYIEDDEEFKPSPYADAITMGAFVRDLLLSQFYFETIFPRIPTVVEKHVKEELQRRGLKTVAVGNAGTGGPDRRGVDEGNKRPASVKAALSVSFGQTAPNRRNAREKDFRTTEPPKAAKVAKVIAEKPDNNNGGGGGRDSYDRDRRDRDYDRRDRDRDDSSSRRDRERDSGRGDRDRDYGADRHDRDRGRDSDRDYDRRDRDRDRRDHRDYDKRDSDRRDRGRDYQDRRDHRDRGRDYDRRDRERSPPRRGGAGGGRGGGGGGGGRPASDVFRDAGRPASDVFRDSSSVFRDAPVAPADLTNLKSRYG